MTASRWESFLQLALLLFNKELQSFKCSRSVSQPVLNTTTFQTCMWFNSFHTKPRLHLLDLIIYDFCFYYCSTMGTVTVMSIYSFFTLAKAPQLYSFNMHLT